MRVAALVKQIPRLEAMALGEGGRLVRAGVELEMSAYCRRAVAKGVELAAETGGSCTVFTLGPPSAAEVLREAIAWGADAGVLVSDPRFAGSDTLATARALAAALGREGPFDLVLVGRNSLDADTGQVGPELAQLLDLPFVTAARTLTVTEGGEILARSESDDGYSERRTRLPAIVSTAERLCEPCKVDAAGRAAVPPGRIRTLGAADLGPGPWGEDGSGTYVGEVRVLDVGREHRLLHGPPDEQVDEAVRALVARGALTPDAHAAVASALRPTGGERSLLVLVEPARPGVTRELLGAANGLAAGAGARVVAVGTDGDVDGVELGSWGADELVVLHPARVEEDVADGLAALCREEPPWAVLAPGTTWGREVTGRLAAALGAGLTGDAIDLEVATVRTTGEPQLLAWKPAFGGRLVAAIYCSSPVQMATVRAGVLPAPAPRSPAPGGATLPRRTVDVRPRGRVVVDGTVRDDDVERLAAARRIVGVGTGVLPEEYPALGGLLEVLGAELGATRKVTDRGWLPRSRQIGITGRSVAPQLYVAVGVAGKFNHTVGVRAAGTVLAVNRDHDAPVWEHADIGIVADWHDIVPRLTDRLRSLVG